MSINPTVRAYEPPLSKDGEPLVPGQEPEIYPGVCGYAMEYEGEIWIPVISAKNPGSGEVGKFLDVLSRRCRFVNVTSPRLEGMLERRGWKPKAVWVKSPYGPQSVDVWSR